MNNFGFSFWLSKDCCVRLCILLRLELWCSSLKRSIRPFTYTQHRYNSNIIKSVGEGNLLLCVLNIKSNIKDLMALLDSFDVRKMLIILYLMSIERPTKEDVVRFIAGSRREIKFRKEKSMSEIGIWQFLWLLQSL